MKTHQFWSKKYPKKKFILFCCIFTTKKWLKIHTFQPKKTKLSISTLGLFLVLSI
jgi:hypothetical protein